MSEDGHAMSYNKLHNILALKILNEMFSVYVN